MFDTSRKKDPVRRDLLLKPGLVSTLAFPVLIGITGVIILILCSIHYPRTVNARVLLTDTSQKATMITVELDASDNNLYDIDEGQQVNLRLPDYPYARYGILEGRIDYIFGVTPNNSLKARIFLPFGLRTNKGQEIRYRHDLKADGLVIIRDMRLMQRIMSGPVRSYR